MSNSKIKDLSKKKVIDKIISDKKEVLADFKSNQKTKLDQASSEDMDNRHIDSKNEETLFELDLLNHNIEILDKEILLLQNIPVDYEMEVVKYGCLVETNDGVLLVGAANEKVEIDGVMIIGISTSAPFYKKMKGLAAGDKFEINGNAKSIVSVK